MVPMRAGPVLAAAIRKITPVGTDWVTTTIAGKAGSLGTADVGRSEEEERNWPVRPPGASFEPG